ncbi:unnamed protein product [Strongylus vulgaris]|uniref:Uncharacterized protein n=1 Tax=Strongylus vulgaris TaxID=40348 RepID=A0A3P7KJT5_STRVU|nr:unnamed protein product [Strongylus vulgaris]
MNSSLRYPYVRRSTAQIDGEALQHLLLNERIWRNAFDKPTSKLDVDGKKTKWSRFVGYLQFAYEKSRLHYLFPIILLFAYSLLGGLIFWSIERSHEEVILTDKSNFIDALKEELLNVIMRVHERLSEYNRAYAWVARKKNFLD